MTDVPSGMPSNASLEADVCLIVEGCYPYVRGGVSTWLDWLMRSLPEIRFSVLAIVADAELRESRYQRPDNLIHFQNIVLHRAARPLIWLPRHRVSDDGSEISAEMVGLVQGGGLAEMMRINALVNGREQKSHADLISSPLAWNVVCEMYRRLMPQTSFLHFFWAWQALCGGLFSCLKAEIPPARVYHAISTGYAGLLAARAAADTGRPALVTEHGIYTNERRIEILMASWIADTVDKGLSLGDSRIDLRDLWMKFFDAYARCCYQACRVITTLYADNQPLQIHLGADRSRLEVIANGIDLGRFDSLPRATDNDRPTVALIGRVVPIKDIKTFILAARAVRERVPEVRALIVGPYDEDPPYYAECCDLVSELDLADTVSFTGNRDIAQILPEIHVVALTSLSEAQPLVLLEAGAAGIPCVTTDVGSCREILEGRPEEDPHCGKGGIVCDLVDVAQIAAGISDLLINERKRRACGDALCERVGRFYVSHMAAAAYRKLYGRWCAASDTPSPMTEAA